jgi:PHP family Zn ribbon phosphoesterase
MDRIRAIADRGAGQIAPHHPPYFFQVPLEFIPGLGKKKLQAMLDTFGTEMNILHSASEQEIREAAGEDIASAIIRAREGSLAFEAGGGGRYGKVSRP